jgi:hypothetical protein
VASPIIVLPFGRVESCADEMMDVDFGILLPVPVNAPVALLHAIWIPRNFVVNELPAMILEIHTLGRPVDHQLVTSRETAAWG